MRDMTKSSTIFASHKHTNYFTGFNSQSTHTALFCRFVPDTRLTFSAVLILKILNCHDVLQDESTAKSGFKDVSSK